MEPILTIPQASLDVIRGVVDAIGRGASTINAIAKRTSFGYRRANYGVTAAQVLGLASTGENGYRLTSTGTQLTATQQGSEQEAQTLIDAVATSTLIGDIAPGLMSDQPPDLSEIAKRIRSVAALSPATAIHRARMLLKWRKLLGNRRMEFSRSSATRATAKEGPKFTLEVKNFAQIKDAKIEFGDLTVLVGPQATGKSLMLQWLKAGVDIAEIYPALREAGHDVKGQDNLLNLIFGDGMCAGWRDGETSVAIDGKALSMSTWTRQLKKRNRGKVFFIPAHRAMLLADGWPAPFVRLTADTPVVARLFSQDLYQRFSGRQAAALFPVSRILKEQYREKIDEAIFHGGRVELEKSGLRYRLTLSYKHAQHLPFMTWTAGQREFTPLLLGLYHVLPPRKVKRVRDVDWIVIEEPEMGLHPDAIAVFMLLVLDLLWRGYRVVISTHSPLVLDVVWAIRQLKERQARWQLLSEAFGVSNAKAVQSVMTHALTCKYRVFLMSHGSDGLVSSTDISELDPSSPSTAEAEWGGLTGFSSRFADAVRFAANEAESD